MGRGKNKVQTMPKCVYGAACTRKDCVYTHPPRSKKDKKKPEVVKSDKVCLAFLSGICTFGRFCKDQHIVDEEERDRIIAVYRARPCHYGALCHTPGCLYGHPEQLTVGTGASESTPTVEDKEDKELKLGNGDAVAVSGRAVGAMPPATNEERLRAFYSDHDPGLIGKIPHMLERFAGRESDFFASLEKKYGAAVPDWGGVALTYQPTVKTRQLQEKQTTPFRESIPQNQLWKAAPSSVSAEEALQNNNNATNGLAIQYPDFATFSSEQPPTQILSSQAHMSSVPTDPMAAMATAAMIGSRRTDTGLTGFSVSTEKFRGLSLSNAPTGAGVIGRPGDVDLTGGLPPSPAQHQLDAPLHFPRAADLVAAIGENIERSSGYSTSLRRTKPGTIAIPSHLYTRDVSRDAAKMYAIPDPMERFIALNGEQRQRGALDLHYQSTRTAAIVLERLLDEEIEIVRSASYAAADKGTPVGRPVVWLITGTGHHTERNTFAKVGALAEFVEQYLIEGGYRYAYGKDPSGYSGAFAVFA